jgi:hypothetical protein
MRKGRGLVVRNEKGVALMVTMVLSAVALAIMSSLIYMLTVGTQVSGGQKRYETSQEAVEGGMGVVFDWIGFHKGVEFPGYIAIANKTSDECLEDKLILGTPDWDSSCDAKLDIDFETNTTYDFSFDLGSENNKYTVYAKIVNTVEGNSGPGGTNLRKTGVVASNSGEVAVRQISFLYAIEIESRNASNPYNMAERARFSLLYRY